MCGLCGLFQTESDWTEAPAIASNGPSRQQRLRRVGYANRVLAYYRLRLDDWQGQSYLLNSPTGATEVIDNLARLWPVAERLAKRPCDPLDPGLLRFLGRE